jgi:hypothetical protein
VQCGGWGRRTLNDVRRREITPARTVYTRRGAILSEADGLSLSVSLDVNHRLGKGMRSFPSRQSITFRRLGTVYGYHEHVEVGGLVSYGVNLDWCYVRTAYFVDKILKGAKPADLPVEFPTTPELWINQKTTKALGLKIPPTVGFTASGKMALRRFVKN